MRFETLAPACPGGFPERAMAFIEREQLPPQILKHLRRGRISAVEAGFAYNRDYVDGRAIPFGPKLFSHLQEVLQSSPDSPVWEHEVQTYTINTVLLSLARYDGLRFVGAPNFSTGAQARSGGRFTWTRCRSFSCGELQTPRLSSIAFLSIALPQRYPQAREQKAAPPNLIGPRMLPRCCSRCNGTRKRRLRPRKLYRSSAIARRSGTFAAKHSC